MKITPAFFPRESLLLLLLEYHARLYQTLKFSTCDINCYMAESTLSDKYEAVWGEVIQTERYTFAYLLNRFQFITTLIDNI